MSGTSYYIRKHVWKSNVDKLGTDVCEHCNSRTGIGFHFIMECGLRINIEGFRKYLEFRNISYADAKKELVKRFTNEVYKTKDLLKEFKKVCDPAETKKVMDEKYVVQNRG